MAHKEKRNNAEDIAEQLGMTAEQLAHVKQQTAAERGRGRRPAGTAGADTKLAGWGQVDGQAQLFTTDTPGRGCGMSASRVVVAEVIAARDDYDRTLSARRHAMGWQLGANARWRGHAYFWDGRCEHCGAEMSIGSGWSSCGGVRDARDVVCSGPGTAVLTEIETDRVADLITAAVTEFLEEAAR